MNARSTHSEGHSYRPGEQTVLQHLLMKSPNWDTIMCIRLSRQLEKTSLIWHIKCSTRNRLQAFKLANPTTGHNADSHLHSVLTHLSLFLSMPQCTINNWGKFLSQRTCPQANKVRSGFRLIQGLIYKALLRQMSLNSIEFEIRVYQI